MTWVAVAVAGTSATIAGVQYVNNKQKAKKDAKNRPTYQIPPEVAAGLSESQRQAMYGMGEEQKQQYLSNLQRGQSYSLSQGSSRKAGLQGISSLNENQNTGYGNLASMDSQMRQQKQGQVFNQLENSANYKGQAFQLNTSNPYYENIARRNANNGALAQNLSNSVGMAAGGFGGGAKSMNAGSQQPSYNSNQNGMYNYKSSGGGYNYQNDPLNGNYNAPDNYPTTS